MSGVRWSLREVVNLEYSVRGILWNIFLTMSIMAINIIINKDPVLIISGTEPGAGGFIEWGIYQGYDISHGSNSD